jgi:two-component system chemotaxis response regulator CheB
MKRVLIVDDSNTAILALKYALELDPEIKVVGEAKNGKEAFRLIDKLDPDMILMDVYLQKENGIDITGRIMATSPRPILIITGINPKDTAMIFKAMKAGALEVLAKLPARSHPDYERERRRIVRSIKALSGIPVITRRSFLKPGRKAEVEPEPPEVAVDREKRVSYDIIAIGASTGGPPLICDLLSRLPVPFSVPIAIVQHISEGFVRGLAKWLNEATGHKVVICDDDIRIEPGTVYLAPENCHLVMKYKRVLGPASTPPRRYQRPSVDELFESVASSLGKKAIGIILSGMGDDGTQGMVALHSAGALTIAQQPESCVVSSMPKNAIERKSVDLVHSLDDIVDTVLYKTKSR